VTFPSAAGGVTAADCAAGSAAAFWGVGMTVPRKGNGSCGGDVTLPGAAGGVTAADCEAGSATAGSRSGGGSCGSGVTLPRTGGGSCGGDVTLPRAAGGATAADCKAGSATVPRPVVPGRATARPPRLHPWPDGAHSKSRYIC
jgi:hypothetical protein